MFDNNSGCVPSAQALLRRRRKRMVLPAQVKTIGEQAFVNSALTRFRLPDGNALEQIEKSAFQGLEEVEFAFVSLNNLVSIGERAFYGCCSLESFGRPMWNTRARGLLRLRRHKHTLPPCALV